MLTVRTILLCLFAVSFDVSLAMSQMIVAHRGASHDAPENTLAAFRLAWQQGSDGIEGDFFLTKDSKIVCIHDRDTERTAGVKKFVEESTLAELRELEYGSWKDKRWKGEVIPTLEEVVQTVPEGKLLVIELKSKRTIVPVLAEELSRIDTDSIRLLVIAFDEETVAASKKLMPDTKVHWLTRFKDDDGDGAYVPTAPQIAATVKRLGADGVGMHANRDVVDEGFIRQLKQAGCREFHFWTVDLVEDAEFYQSVGSMGITTNRPGEIAASLRD